MAEEATLSLRQVSDANGDGDADTEADADADRWHQESDCPPLPHRPSHNVVVPPTGQCIAPGQGLPSRWIFSCKEHRQSRLVEDRVSPVPLAALLILMAAGSVTRH